MATDASTSSGSAKAAARSRGLGWSVCVARWNFVLKELGGVGDRHGGDDVGVAHLEAHTVGLEPARDGVHVVGLGRGERGHLLRREELAVGLGGRVGDRERHAANGLSALLLHDERDRDLRVVAHCGDALAPAVHVRRERVVRAHRGGGEGGEGEEELHAAHAVGHGVHLHACRILLEHRQIYRKYGWPRFTYFTNFTYENYQELGILLRSLKKKLAPWK